MTESVSQILSGRQCQHIISVAIEISSQHVDMVLIMDYNDKDKDIVGLIWCGYLYNLEIMLAIWVI